MAALAILPALAADLPVVRVGVLKFGTVSWELDVLRRHGLDRAHGVQVEPLELAGKDGAAVALQGGAVDVILTDWLWVARRRALGGDFTFVPHSHATGGVMVKKGGDIKSIADLKGRKIGIGGGPVDKSWLVLRAYARKTAGLDLAKEAQPVFAAPCDAAQRSLNTQPRSGVCGDKPSAGSMSSTRTSSPNSPSGRRGL